ncbi:MAG: L,D-transpeptidase family protein [Anaerolineales bacterium]|nr:L,D-transpeptidase family protein [Anaerolineales bacterium]
MSNNSATSATENLRLGIEAARAGQHEAARKHLTRVLEYTPHNIPALLWLAYVAPEPAESIRWLTQVLAIDPHNQRALSGLEWVRKRSDHSLAARSPSDHGSEPNNSVQASHAETELPDDFIRDQFLKGAEAQKRARKAALAQRARRNIAPLTLVLLIIAVTLLFGAATWYLVTVPDETLAAWLPEPAQLPVEPAPVEAKSLPVETELDRVEPAKAEADEVISPPNFTSKVDTIILANSKLAETLETDDPFTPLEENQLPPLDIPPVLNEAAETTSALDLLQLVGPAEEMMDGIRLFVPVDEALLAYQPVTPHEKWIEVDIPNQRVTAWEGNVPVMAFESSTGLPDTPTVTGQFNIYWKLKSTVMIGADYYLPEVPYTMYFYGGYALHGAYWHNNFGQPMSHGCVNLSIDNSKTLFEWADPIIPPGETQVVSSYDNPGTLVVVHQ